MAKIACSSVGEGCWGKPCMLLKAFTNIQLLDSGDFGEKNVGEIVYWRIKICSFTNFYMLVKTIIQIFDKWNMLAKIFL